jgi:hypothetical protein
MRISEWLDEKEADGFDVSQIALPEELSYDEPPEETIFFEEFRPCGILCAGNHPFSIVERYGHWYYCRGQDKKAGIHAFGGEWTFFTKNKEIALKTAQAHIK